MTQGATRGPLTASWLVSPSVVQPGHIINSILGEALTHRLDHVISRVLSQTASKTVQREDVERIMRLELSAFLFLTDEYNRAQGIVGWDTQFRWFMERRQHLRLWLDKPAKLRKLRKRAKPFSMFNMTESSDEENHRPVGNWMDVLNEETLIMPGKDREEVVPKNRDGGEVEVVCAKSTTHVSETTEDQEEEEKAKMTSTPLMNTPKVVRWSLSPISNNR